LKVALLSGGVGGARLARGLAAVADDLTVIANVGDDDEIYGVHVSADLDTLLYTLAGREGPHGWGVRDDTFATMDRLEELGLDTRFRLGDADLAICLARTSALRRGTPLSTITDDLRKRFGVGARIVPATDGRLRTLVRVDDGWIGFFFFY